MSSYQGNKLFLEKMKARGIEVVSGVPGKNDRELVYELIHIANYFPELREKEN